MFSRPAEEDFIQSGMSAKLGGWDLGERWQVSGKVSPEQRNEGRKEQGRVSSENLC